MGHHGVIAWAPRGRRREGCPRLPGGYTDAPLKSDSSMSTLRARSGKTLVTDLNAPKVHWITWGLEDTTADSDALMK